MSIRGFENNEQSAREGCGCNNGNRSLEYFHGIVMKAIEEFQAADELSDKAITCARRAVELQERAAQKTDCGRSCIQKAYQWLERYGSNYDCNYTNPACQRLLQQLQCLADKQAKLDEYGLDQVCNGLAAWRKSEALSKKQQCVTQKYIQCIHDTRDGGCGCQDDCLWD